MAVCYGDLCVIGHKTARMVGSMSLVANGDNPRDGFGVLMNIVTGLHENRHISDDYVSCSSDDYARMSYLVLMIMMIVRIATRRSIR